VVSSFSPPKDFGPKGFLKEICRRKSYDSMNPEGPGALAKEKWMDQMDKGASERIAEALLFLQDHFSHQNWTRREIAQWAGTTPETVIRTLSQFEKEGLIDQTDGRSIRILSKEKLRERADVR